MFIYSGVFNHKVEADNISGSSAEYEGAKSLHASYKHMFCIGFDVCIQYELHHYGAQGFTPVSLKENTLLK